MPAVAATPDPVVEGLQIAKGSVARHHVRSLRRAGISARVRWRPRRGGWTVSLRGVDAGSARADLADLAARAAAVTGGAFVWRWGGPDAEPVAPNPDVLWARARRSQGPTASRARVVDADVVRFRFVRTLPDGRTITHRYERRGNWVSVAYHPFGSPGEEVRIVATADGATLHQPGEPSSAVSATRARDVVARFAPDEVLRPLLALPGILSAPGAADVRVVTTPDEGPVAFALGRGSAADQVWVDPATGWVTGALMRSDAGVVELAFEGRAVDTAVPLPLRVTTRHDGEVIDDVMLLELALESRPETVEVGTPGS